MCLVELRQRGLWVLVSLVPSVWMLLGWVRESAVLGDATISIFALRLKSARPFGEMLITATCSPHFFLSVVPVE